MSSPRRAQFPAQAIDWMVGTQPSRVLNVAGSAALPRLLADRGHGVMAVHGDPDACLRLAADGRIVALNAQPEALPFDPCQFDAITCHQSFHRFHPTQTLSEMARVLRPGGVACVSYLVRDDSVPWVRRLTKLLRTVDEHAMEGNYGDQSVERLLDSKYFPQVEHRSFRMWQPVDRATLLGMVSSQGVVRRLDPARRQRILDEAAQLHADAAPAADDLKLPYQLKIWRAWVDHDELTAPIEVDHDGLVIPI